MTDWCLDTTIDGGEVTQSQNVDCLDTTIEGGEVTQSQNELGKGG